MRRRDFLGALSGVAVAWPFAARAQQGGQKRRVGIVAGFSASEMQPLLTAFLGQLEKLGWAEDRNLTLDMRLGAGDFMRMRDDTAGLIALKPDVIEQGLAPEQS